GHRPCASARVISRRTARCANSPRAATSRRSAAPTMAGVAALAAPRVTPAGGAYLDRRGRVIRPMIPGGWPSRAADRVVARVVDTSEIRPTLDCRWFGERWRPLLRSRPSPSLPLAFAVPLGLVLQPRRRQLRPKNGLARFQLRPVPARRPGKVHLIADSG